VIGTGPTLLQRVASTRRVDCWKWASTKFTERAPTCTMTTLFSVMLCAGVPDGEKREASGLFGKAESAKEEVSDRSCLVVF
jgi:hypothetical protein